jgi:hypothetical protein
MIGGSRNRHVRYRTSPVPQKAYVGCPIESSFNKKERCSCWVFCCVTVEFGWKGNYGSQCHGEEPVLRRRPDPGGKLTWELL